MNTEDLARDIRLDQLEIAKQSIQDRDRKIEQLLTRVELLEGMLNRVSAAQAHLPQPQPLPAIRTHAPRRWSVR